MFLEKCRASGARGHLGNHTQPLRAGLSSGTPPAFSWEIGGGRRQGNRRRYVPFQFIKLRKCKKTFRLSPVFVQSLKFPRPVEGRLPVPGVGNPGHPPYFVITRLRMFDFTSPLSKVSGISRATWRVYFPGLLRSKSLLRAKSSLASSFG